MKKFFNKRVIVIVAVVALLGLAAVVVPRVLATPLQIRISTGAAAEATPETGADHDGTSRGERGHQGERPAVPYPLRERVVNLADKGGFRYLKIEVVLDVAVPHSKPGDKPPKGEEIKKAQEEVALELTPLKPRLEDAITTLLTSKTSEELMTPEGKQRLRDELRERLDRLSPELPITGVYFTQFIIQ